MQTNHTKLSHGIHFHNWFQRVTHSCSTEHIRICKSQDWFLGTKSNLAFFLCNTSHIPKRQTIEPTPPIVQRKQSLYVVLESNSVSWLDMTLLSFIITSMVAVTYETLESFTVFWQQTASKLVLVQLADASRFGNNESTTVHNLYMTLLIG